MVDFFRNMNFPRAVIVLCLAASAGLGWLAYQRTMRLQEIQDELVRVETLIRQIQERAMELDELQKISSENKFRNLDMAESFIRETAADPVVKVGQVDITPKTKVPYKGVEDRIYSVRPLRKEQRFHREQIGNFLYRLEEKGTHVKVTSIEITPHEKLKAGEIGNDEWIDPVLGEIGWYYYNYTGFTFTPAQKIPNSWGLFDMHGGTPEWCWDWYGLYSPEPEIDPVNVKYDPVGDIRVLRGTLPVAGPKTIHCRSAYRSGYEPTGGAHDISTIRIVWAAGRPESTH